MKNVIYCPICHKTVCKMDTNGEMRKVFLWCRRCKKEIYIEDAEKFKDKSES